MQDGFPYRYWAFISYSSADRSWARWLHRAIESYGIPARLVGHPTPTGEPSPRRLRPIFHDRAELAAAADLGAEIEEALQASRYLIVICSPNAARSKWVNREVETFQRLRGAENVLALIVDGRVNAGDERECFPTALRPGTPVAADVRPGGDGKRNAMLKLLAGMLGVGFDDLRQRDNRRRMRRLQIGIGLALVIAVALAGLAAYAENRRAAAVAARQRAESLVEYLLYDLGNRLQPLGRLDILQDMQTQVDTYFAQLGGGSGDPYTRLAEAAAHQRKGDLLLAQGNAAGALKEFQAGMDIYDAAASAQPGDPRLRRILAYSYDGVGRAFQAQGNLPAAALDYQAALGIRTRLAPFDPGNADLQYELATSHTTLGTLLWQEQDLTRALAEFRASLAVKQKLAAAAPDDTDLQYSVALTRSNVGAVLDQAGQSAAAQQEYQAGLAIMDKLVASDFANATWQRVQAALHNNMGASLEAQKNVAAALPEYQQAVEIMEKLVASDPTNAEWKDDLTQYQKNTQAAAAGTQ